MIFHRANPCKFRGIEGKEKLQTWTNPTRLWEPNGLMLNRWAVYDHIYGISPGMRRECRCLWAVCGDGCRNHGAVCRCELQHIGISFACCIYLWFQQTETEKRINKPCQALNGLVRLVWLIKLVLAGGEPSHFSKKVQIELILTAEKISVCWKKHYYS